jgi:DNA-binding XRE family transcriptional regulator
MIIEANNLTSILEEITKDRAITPEMIAYKVGVSPMTVYRWRNGRAKPKSKIVKQSFENFLKTLDKQ